MLSNTKRTTIKKGAHKAVFEQEKLHQIIDESLIAHIALQGEHGPMVIPMLAWRVDDMVYIHGAKNSRLLNIFIEQIAPGRTDEVRLSNEKELNATELLAIPLTETSVKIGKHGVNDDKADMDVPVWAGVLPYRTVVGPLETVPEQEGLIEKPDYQQAYGERWYQDVPLR